jgi:hypothetical protein
VQLGSLKRTEPLDDIWETLLSSDFEVLAPNDIFCWYLGPIWTLELHECNVIKRRRIAGGHLSRARGDIYREVGLFKPFNIIFSFLFVMWTIYTWYGREGGFLIIR